MELIADVRDAHATRLIGFGGFSSGHKRQNPRRWLGVLRIKALAMTGCGSRCAPKQNPAD
jgi:hypothetical protein